MPTPQELIAQALKKQNAVSSAAQSKRDALTQQDHYNISASPGTAGLATATPTEVDLRTLNPSQLRSKYGSEQAASLMAEQARGDRNFVQDAGGPRTYEGAAGDAVAGVGMGVVNSLGGIAALGAGVVSPTAGGFLADELSKFNEWGQGTQSEALQGRRRAMTARNAAGQRDNAAQFEQDKKTDGDLLAGLKRIGRDALGALETGVQDPAVLSDGIAQGVGSLLGGIPLGTGLKALGVGERAAMPLAIGAMEGGGAYSETSKTVQDMSLEDLNKNSEDFRSMVASGVSPSDAKMRIANNAALTAAAIQAPIGVATGTLVSKFEGAPLASKNIRQSLSNIARETVEEGIQSASGQSAQNFAIQSNADSTQSLTEGVGEQTALGALYGAGTAGALQAPKASLQLTKKAVGTTYQGLKGVAGAAVGSIAARADAVVKKNEAASPLADQAVSQAAAEVAAVAPEANTVMKEGVAQSTATPEEKEQANTYVDKLTSSLAFDEADEGIFDEVRPALAGSANRIEAVQRSALQIREAIQAKDMDGMLAAAGSLVHLMAPIRELIAADPEAKYTIPADHPAHELIANYSSLITKLDQSTTVKAAVDEFQKFMSEVQIAEQTQESLDTPEGQRAARDAITVASLIPDQGNVNTVNAILKHAKEGKLTLTSQQYAALMSSKALLEAEKNARDERARLGIETESNRVRDEIITSNEPLSKISKSALQHTQRIVQAMNAGNTELGISWLEDMGKFVTHMGNKVEALNTHFAGGNQSKPVKYQYLQANNKRDFKESGEGVYVNTFSNKSIGNAQDTALDANILADVFNGLVATYPDLGIAPIEVPQLAPALMKSDATTLAKEFRAAAKKPAPVVAEAPKVQEQAKPEPKKETVIEPADEIIGKREAAIEEALEAAVQKAEQPVVEAKPVVPVNAMDSLFPDLVSHVTNYFKKAFKVPAEAKTRIIGTGAPIQVIRDALVSTAAYSSLVGSDVGMSIDSTIAKAYKEHLAKADDIEKSMKASLKKFLKDKVKGSFTEAKSPHRWRNGKALNITEERNGTYEYNQELLEAAILAGLQFQLDVPNLERLLENDDVEAIANQDITAIDDADIERIRQGMSLEEVKRALSSTILRYWGVSKNRNVDKAYADGIVENVASEVMTAMEDLGMMEIDTIKITDQDGKPRTINRYIVQRPSMDADIMAFPDAIEKAVSTEPEEKYYFGDAKPPVATGQMNNGDVPLTADQKVALANEQETPFYANVSMINFYSALGVENILQLFGSGDMENRSLNVNHKKSLDGMNRTTTAAVNHLFNTVAALQNHADTAGQSIDQVPVRYGYNFSRVGRMQMLGKYNPQSNKIMREAFLPTWSTLDLSQQGQDSNSFYLALGQAFGVKVHNMPFDESRAKTQALLDGKLKPAADVIEQWLSSNDITQLSDTDSTFTPEQVSTIKESFGKDLTNVGLFALVEAVRFNRATPEERKSFRTALYLEADGVTNGVVNAMMLLTTGEFTEQQLVNVAKGGVSIGTKKTMADLRADDAKDLYQASTDETINRLNDQINNFKSMKDDVLIDQTKYLMTLLSLTSPDVIFDPAKNFGDGSMQLLRGILKNPLTITLYGSGAEGIANKLVNMVSDSVYERMSFAAQNMKDFPGMTTAEALFYGDPDSDRKARQFNISLDNLRKREIVAGKDGSIWARNAKDHVSFASWDKPEEFTLSKSDKEVMTSNMLNLFVKPMRMGIEDTVGSTLMQSAQLVQKATQVQGIALQYAFREAVKTALTNKSIDPDWKAGDFLSDKELSDINAELRKSFPLVQNGVQAFQITKSQAMSFVNSEFGASFADRFRTDADTYAPADPGVSGIPFLNIGMGDGLMMQLLSLDKNIKGTLKIFDGMNMPLDKINEYSVLANQAVYETWQGNPLRSVEAAYSKFLDTAQIPEEAIQEIKNILLDKESASTAADADVQSEMRYLLTKVSAAANSVDQRHKALNDVAMSVDQMAAAGQPYTNNNRQFDVAPTMDEAAVELNKRMLGKQPAATPAVKKLGTAHSSGAQVLSWTSMKAFAKSLSMTPAQQVIYGEIIRSMGTKEYKVVMGSTDELRAYQEATGQSQGDLDVNGYVSIGDRTIYLVNPSAETLVHELIHASSYESLLAHFSGEKINPEASEAIQRLSVMMREFMDMEGSADMQTAQSAIQNYSTQFTPEGDAAALNEFMAWALTNEKLTDTLATKKAPAIVQFAKSAVKFLKQIIWGKKKAPSYDESFLANLQFNAAIVIRTQPTMAKQINQAVLNANKVYGSGDRLTDVRKTFAATIGNYMNRSPIDGGIQVSNMLRATSNLVNAAVGSGFSMNQQEKATFTQIALALATEAQIDTNALAQAQELFTHVTSNLSVEDFMVNPQSTNPNDRAQAQAKYDMIAGKTILQKDSQGRSSLLSVFLALATTNDEFRAVLSKLPVPKSQKNKEKTLDATLENLGTEALDKLSVRLSGQGNATNVKDAVDNLHVHIQQTLNDDQMFLEEVASKAGGIVDRANDWMVDGLQKLSTKGIDLSKKMKQSNSKSARTAASYVEIVSRMATEEGGEQVAMGVMEMLNKTNAWKPFQEFVGDLVGRTKSNENVYDMIKQTRATIQQIRQQFREAVPRIIASKFTRDITDSEWKSMYKVLAKTDLASIGDIKMLNQKDRTAAIASLEKQVNPSVKQKAKMKQLANYMNTGIAGNNLLRNATTISRMFGEVQTGASTDINGIDQLVTLYALDSVDQTDLNTISSLAQTEGKGLDFVLSYLKGQRKEELSKAHSAAEFNHYKGYIPIDQQAGVNLIITDDKDFSKLMEQSYTRVGDYKGSNLDSITSTGYYFAPVNGRAAYSQGILQNVRATAGGVDIATGFSMSMTAGRITDPKLVKQIANRLRNEGSTNEPLLPVYDDTGTVIAFERGVDPSKVALLNPSMHLPQQIGIWRGRQVEERRAEFINAELIGNLHDMYKADMQASSSNQKQYVNLFDYKALGKDAILADSVGLLNNDTRKLIKDKFGAGEFWVRKDMLNDAIGYRNATVGDAWTGNTRWNKETQDTVKKLALATFGNDTYKYIVNAERILMNFVSDARTTIVVKSVIVPIANFTSNIFQLISRGVPIANITKSMPAKLSEIDTYTKSKLRQINIEAELRATTNPIEERKLRTEIRSITDSHKRMSIWPLIEAGEFSTIADVGMTHEDLQITSGRLGSFIESQVDKLPGNLKTIGRYGLVTRDTALFQGLQKAVQYGDFLAKAVMYDDLINRKGLTKEQTLGRITEEFVNYDRLTGRTRGYLENIGLLWFYNFKIRAAKVGLSMIRNNPLHSLIAAAVPVPSIFGSVGTPIDDNIFTKALEGTLGYSVGPSQGLSAPGLNPWWNLAN